MSLRGYKKKGRPALWLSVRGAQPVRFRVAVKTAPKPRTWIRPVSAKMSKARRAYLRERNSWLAGKLCAVGRCLAWATEVHHTRGRAGSLLTNDKFWLAVCNGCHNWIHNNIEQARKRGLICAKGDWNRQP